MTPPSRRSSGCRKVRYPDELSARIALAAVRRTRRKETRPVERRTYLCPLCHWWHLTSKPRRRGRRRAS